MASSDDLVIVPDFEGLGVAPGSGGDPAEEPGGGAPGSPGGGRGRSAVALASRINMAGAAAFVAFAVLKSQANRSFANLGANLAEYFFRDEDDSARAAKAVRGHMAGNPILAHAVAALGVEESGALEMFNRSYQFRLREELGIGAVMRDQRFDVKSNWDIFFDAVGNYVVSKIQETGTLALDVFTGFLRGESAEGSPR